MAILEPATIAVEVRVACVAHPRTTSLGCIGSSALHQLRHMESTARTTREEMTVLVGAVAAEREEASDDPSPLVHCDMW